MNQLKDPTANGWIIQIYGQNRRLLCALEPSHGWTFLAGLVVGLGFAFMTIHPNPAAPTVKPQTVAPPNSEFTAPLTLD